MMVCPVTCYGASGDCTSCWQLAQVAGHATQRRMPGRMLALLAEHQWDWKVGAAGAVRLRRSPPRPRRHVGQRETRRTAGEAAR
jgi:hypothetical protein